MERLIGGIIRFLQEHLVEDISLFVPVKEFHLNAQYISQLFKSEIGVNFKSPRASYHPSIGEPF